MEEACWQDGQPSGSSLRRRGAKTSDRQSLSILFDRSASFRKLNNPLGAGRNFVNIGPGYFWSTDLLLLLLPGVVITKALLKASCWKTSPSQLSSSVECFPANLIPVLPPPCQVSPEAVKLQEPSSAVSLRPGRWSAWPSATMRLSMLVKGANRLDHVWALGLHEACDCASHPTSYAFLVSTRFGPGPWQPFGGDARPTSPCAALLTDKKRDGALHLHHSWNAHLDDALMAVIGHDVHQ